MRTRAIHLAIHRRFGVLLTIGAMAVGAAVHAAPASAQERPSGTPNEAGAELPGYNCGGCSLPAVDNDYDDDGLPNSSESRYATDLRDPDTDGDGLLDGFEVRERYEYPRYGNRLRDRTSPTVWDTDGDGYSDGLEVKYTKTNPVKHDSDGDGLSDGSEGKTYRTNPNKKDTDGDCRSDGAEVRAGTDPTKRSQLRPVNCATVKKLVPRAPRVSQPIPQPR
ncbi:MAG TPA: hypothetical protein VGV90_16715 [Solirubrobacteraceae bacterium]|nr:hypothetical protein [Solirubrobacteraceae bacterium]